MAPNSPILEEFNSLIEFLEQFNKTRSCDRPKLARAVPDHATAIGEIRRNSRRSPEEIDRSQTAYLEKILGPQNDPNMMQVKRLLSAGSET